jgi:hypothetical protein
MCTVALVHVADEAAGQYLASVSAGMGDRLCCPQVFRAQGLTRDGGAERVGYMHKWMQSHVKSGIVFTVLPACGRCTCTHLQQQDCCVFTVTDSRTVYRVQSCPVMACMVCWIQVSAGVSCPAICGQLCALHGLAAIEYRV